MEKQRHKNGKKEPRGLSLDLVKYISRSKNEPAWMLKKRIHAFELWKQTPTPQMEIDLLGIDLENLQYYVNRKFQETDSWRDLPDEIINTFDEMSVIKTSKHK